MAHEITTTDELFSTRKPGWHGLGVTLPEYPTREEAQSLAHPWEPVSTPLYVREVAVGDNGELQEGFREVQTHVANVRSDNGETVGVVGEGYVNVQNNELWDVAEALQGEDAGEVRFETAGSLMGGRKVWILVRLNDPLMVKGDPNGATIPYFALQNAHDGSGAFRGQATMTRIVCHAKGTKMLHEGSWINVEDHPGVMAHKDEDGLHVNVAGLPTAETVTLDHMYWVDRAGERGWVKARNLQRGTDRIGLPIDYEPIDGPNPLGLDGDDLREFWWAAGLFWADGNLHGTRQVTWSVNDHADRLLGFLRKQGFTGKGSEREGVRQVTWSNADVRELFEEFYRGDARGKGQRDKRPPRYLEQLRPDLLEAFADGYFDGDGSYDRSRGGRIWASSNVYGLLSLRRMLLNLGHVSLLRKGRTENFTVLIGDREVIGKPSWTLREPAGNSVLAIEDGFLWSPVTELHWAGTQTFVPLDTSATDNQYVTDFGRSHNCSNTSKIADLDAKARGTEFTFRHSKNIGQRIEQAKQALSGWKHSLEEWQLMNEHLMTLTLEKSDVTEFIERFIPEPLADLVSDRVRENVAEERRKLRGIFNSATMEGIDQTAYGLVNASIEYAEHFRKAQTEETRFKRAYLDSNRLVSLATKLALEVAR